MTLLSTPGRYLACIRYRECLVLTASPFLGVVLSPETFVRGSLGEILLFAVASFSLLAFVFVLNDWADADSDANDPDKTCHFTALGVSPQMMRNLGLGLLASALCLFAPLPLRTLLLAVAIASLSFLYSHPIIRAKGVPLVSSVVHLIGGMFHFLLGFSLFSPLDQRSIMISLFFALTFAAGHLSQEVRDYAGDLRNGIFTNAVKFGKNRVFIAGQVVFGLAYGHLALLAILGYLPRPIGLLTLLYVFHLYAAWSAFLAGLDFEDTSRFQMRYRGLYAIIGFAMLVPATTLLFPPNRAAPPHPNLILISIDTLRADHLSCYGYNLPTSPTLDSLASRATLFLNVWAPAPWTLPSHAAMLTGRHPFEMGIRKLTSGIPPGVPLVSELLAAGGYETAAFVDSLPDGFVGAARGFSRGFGRFEHMTELGDGTSRPELGLTVKHAASWLRKRQTSQPFFLFLHTKSVHSEPSSFAAPAPYSKPPNYQELFLEPQDRALSWEDEGAKGGTAYLMRRNVRMARGLLRKEDVSPARVRALIALYDAGIRYVDDQLLNLLDVLQELDLTRETALIVTSDHGEAFLEHRYFLHQELHRELLRVPLIVFLPWSQVGRTESGEGNLQDLPQTLLDIAGVSTPPDLPGRSLVAPAPPSQGRGPQYFYAHADDKDFYSAFAVRENGWYLLQESIDGGRENVTSVYELTSDPEAQRPLVNEPRTPANLESLLSNWRAARATKSAPQMTLSTETMEHLNALGYLSGNQ